MDPTPGESVQLMHQKMKTNMKKAKYSIPWLLLSVIAKMSVKDSSRLSFTFDDGFFSCAEAF